MLAPDQESNGCVFSFHHPKFKWSGKWLSLSRGDKCDLPLKISCNISLVLGSCGRMSIVMEIVDGIV